MTAPGAWGAELKAQREIRGWSQGALGRAVRTRGGFTWTDSAAQKRISELELGKPCGSHDDARRIARALSIAFGFFVPIPPVAE